MTENKQTPPKLHADFASAHSSKQAHYTPSISTLHRAKKLHQLILVISVQQQQHHHPHPSINPRLKIIQLEQNMDRKKMESKKQIKNGDHVNFFFQMPLHYPRYSKKDYEHMPEWQIDRLLSDYGFSSAIDSLNLASKREFAMGAFLWPDLTHQQTATTTTHPSPSTASCSNKLVKVVEFLYRVLGIA